MFPRSNVTPRRKCLLQLNIMFIIYIHEVDFLCYHLTVNPFCLFFAAVVCTLFPVNIQTKWRVHFTLFTYYKDQCVFFHINHLNLKYLVCVFYSLPAQQRVKTESQKEKTLSQCRVLANRDYMCTINIYCNSKCSGMYTTWHIYVIKMWLTAFLSHKNHQI